MMNSLLHVSTHFYNNYIDKNKKKKNHKIYNSFIFSGVILNEFVYLFTYYTILK